MKLSSSQLRSSTPLLLVVGIGLILSSLLLHQVEGHGYMQTPRTRNRFAAEDGVSGQSPGVPRREYCPHCLNTKEAHELCGHGNTGSFDVWNDSAGNPMPWISQEIFEEGQTFRVDVELTTNHAGHMELYACPMGRASTKECLESNPLTLVTPAHGGPIDNLYPQRGYFSPDYAHTFYYKLPNGLTGDEVLLQWKYITGNSCMSDNYLNPDLGLADLGWLRANTATCPPLSDTGVGTPEQFWNCAEVTIKASSPTISPAPTPATPEPTTKQPTDETEAPTEAPTEAGVGYCNYGHLRDRPCDGLVEGGHWCNQSAGYCEGSCSGKWCTNSGPPPSPPTSSPVPPPPTSTVAPTKTPTAFPTSDVTSSPTALPTPSPTNPPTPASNPTSSPTSSPTKAPTGGGSYCCSQNYKNCESWLSQYDEAGCTSRGYAWIQEGLSCLAKWADCTNNIDGCCSPGTCQGNQWYKQCL